MRCIAYKASGSQAEKLKSHREDSVDPRQAPSLPGFPSKKEPKRRTVSIVGRQQPPQPEAPAVTPEFSPESLELVRRIKERHSAAFAQRVVRNARRAGHHPPGGETAKPETLLVFSAKSDPSHLPPWLYVPTAAARCYQVYRKDAYVCRQFPAVPPADIVPSPRVAIFEFTDKSRRNLDHTCRNSGHLIKSQFCLTYHEQPPEDGKQVKAHLHSWLRALRKRFPEICYLWVLEFQPKRGAPHFHVFLSVDPSIEIQQKLARSWVKITKGTELQYLFHAHRANWIKWAMNDGAYVLKQYATKKDQKEVPAQYHSVGRFWGTSRNMVPFPTIVEPDAVARFTVRSEAPWEQESVRRYFDKVLRRYHENWMNRDQKTGNRRKQKWKRSPLTWQQGELSGSFRVPNGARIIAQLMDYMATNGPDRWSLQAAINERIPF